MLQPRNLSPFPVLFDEPVEAWAWPAPSFQWDHQPAPGIEVEQPCRIDTTSGTPMDGLVCAIDMACGSIGFRTTATGQSLSLPFSRFHQLTLSTPLQAIDAAGDRPRERLPFAAEERDVVLVRRDGSKSAPIRTLGLVENKFGLFLFLPGGTETDLLRSFVPRGAYARFETGYSALEAAAIHWIATPAQLLSAIDSRHHVPVLSMGQALLDLGQLTPEQLQRVAAQPGKAPLGERLVASGVMPPSDLHTAIAHKMGYPLVDLARFPIDPKAVTRLPLNTAVRHRCVPLMFNEQDIIVAMDRPSRAVRLQELYAVAPYRVVAVLAPKSQILAALLRLSKNAPWNEQLAIRTQFYATTT